jgi:MFS family permease
MSTRAGPSVPSPSPKAQMSAEAAVSWLPLIIIIIAQMQMAFNVNAIPVSIGPIVDDLGVSATAVGTALVFYSLVVAGFVMLGAKIGKIVGERLVFQVTVVLHGLAMLLMALANSASMMNLAQALAGLAAAMLVPSLALGALAGSSALAGALAFFIAGWLGTAISWRVSFGMLTIVSFVVLFLSFRLKVVPRQRGVKIDLVGVVISATAIALISFGANNLNSWGIVMAKAAAPFSLLGLSPAPFMIIFGLILGQAFFGWTESRVAKNKTPLLALEVIENKPERSALYTLLVIGALGPAVNFLIPLYIQIVQGGTSFFTAVAVVPYTLAIAFSAIFIVRMYKWLSSRLIGVTGLLLASIGMTLLAFTINNQWGTPIVILGLIIVGLGEGSLLTLLFNVLVSSSPKELAGDVGALRGVANNLSTGLGTAFAGVVAVSLLSLFISTNLVNNPTIPPELKSQINFDNVNFVTNDQLDDVMATTTATPDQVAEAVRINEGARLRALQASFLMLAVFALLAVIPALGLPRYSPNEIPDMLAKKEKKGKKNPAAVVTPAT